MWLEITLLLISALALVAGIVCCFIPILPGPLIAYAGLLCMIPTEKSPSVAVLCLFGVVVVLVAVLDYVVPAMGAKKFNCSKFGVWGCMIGTIAGNFDALFWIEEDAGEYKLCLNAKTEVSSSARKDLLSVSSTGENVAARGIMGKIREIIEVGISHYDEIDRMNLQYGTNFYTCGAVGVDAADAMAGSLFTWSLNQYRDSMASQPESDAWDELEKSIVANIADDVR
ncbi:MAG: DUF456 family protein, partial [Kiritimatiellae bacterium]|nr:DUF456 family protein [Kiritimatiellia bacterium]